MPVGPLAIAGAIIAPYILDTLFGRGEQTQTTETQRSPEEVALQQMMLKFMAPQMGKPAQPYPGQLAPAANPLTPLSMGYVSQMTGVPMQEKLGPLKLPPTPERPPSPRPLTPLSEAELRQMLGGR